MNMAMDFEEESGKSLAEYVAILRRRKKQLLLPALVTFVLVTLIAVLLPATYQATATILIEEQEIPKDLVRSTITSYANQQIQVITQRTMTLKNIMGLVEKYELYDETELKRRSSTSIAQEFREKGMGLDIVRAEVIDPRSGRPTEATIAFTLAYQHNDPVKAQKVTSELVTLYLNENLRSRTEKTANTSDFLKSESSALNLLLVELEDDLAVFKAENEGSLPELYQYNLNIIERTERELLDLSLRHKELEKRKLQITSELLQISPYSATVLSSGELALSDYDRLKSLESEYRRKTAVYSDSHPDVIRLKREIGVLKQSLGGDIDPKDSAELLRGEQSKLAALRQKYTADHPMVVAQGRVVEQLVTSTALASAASVKPSAEAAADNPAYIFQETQLKSTELELKILAEKNLKLREKIRHYEGLILKAPNVEKDYLALQRDYTNAQLKYREIKAKLMEAELSQNLEQERKGERFTLLQPPLVPDSPVSPNRMAIVFVGFILALGVGLGVVVLLEALDDSIRGEKQLTEILGMTPMAIVPYIYIDEEQETLNVKPYYLIGAAIAAGCIGLILIHNLFKPLDVLWYVLLRKVGLG